MQKGTAKKKGTSRKKEDWHGVSLEEKNEIVSTELEIYQTAITRVVMHYLTPFLHGACKRIDGKKFSQVLTQFSGLAGTGSW